MFMAVCELVLRNNYDLNSNNRFGMRERQKKCFNISLSPLSLNGASSHATKTCDVPRFSARIMDFNCAYTKFDSAWQCIKPFHPSVGKREQQLQLCTVSPVGHEVHFRNNTFLLKLGSFLSIQYHSMADGSLFRVF